VNALSSRTAVIPSTLALLALALAGCSGGSDGAGDAAQEPAGTESSSAPSPEGMASTDPTPNDTSEAATATDTGPAAAPGEGAFEVNGTTYALSISECTFNEDGPAEGTFEVTGTDADGNDFEMTQFYLNGDWSQTDVLLDLGGTQIYVIRSSAREGSAPAAVDGKNITWVESFRELDVDANAQVELGTGTLNLTCA